MDHLGLPAAAASAATDDSEAAGPGATSRKWHCGGAIEPPAAAPSGPRTKPVSSSTTNLCPRRRQRPRHSDWHSVIDSDSAAPGAAAAAALAAERPLAASESGCCQS